MTTIEKLTESILKEARRRWRTGIEASDKLAPSLAISMLSDSKWYASLVRWPDRGRKIVEKNANGESLLAVIKTIGDGFVPIPNSIESDPDEELSSNTDRAMYLAQDRGDDMCNCDGEGCAVEPA